VETVPFNIKEGGKENWIRFAAAIDMSAGSKRRREGAGDAGGAAVVEKQTAVEKPNSEGADVLMYEFYLT
jgi:hypothetical protein